MSSAPLAAITTGPAPAAIGVIEVSGPGALAAATACFRAKREDDIRATTRVAPRGAGRACPPKLQQERRRVPARMFLPGSPVLGTLHDDGHPLDEAFLVYVPPSDSWTGEDLVELHCHGGPVVLDAVLEALEKRGVRRGTPADLASRAVRNGKMDRIQAEALACLANARTPLAARVYLDQLNGRLSQFLRELLELPPGQLAEKLDSLLATASLGLALSNPPRVVLAGPPNAGKSTLFNALAGADRAIVHETPGTTRDPVDALIAPAGIPIRLVDTAGVEGRPLWPPGRCSDPPRPPPVGDGFDPTAAAEAATLDALDQADAVLWVVDTTQPVPDALRSLAASTRLPSAWVFNKCDLLQAGSPEPGAAPAHAVSALTGQGVPELSAALPALAGLAAVPSPGAPCVFTVRQRDALEAARRALPDLDRARQAVSALLSP